jgi:uncharacterized membrane protein YjfL (UPF0719 family)
MSDIFMAYAVMAGWILVASLAMGLGIAIVVKLFTISTPEVNEWELVKQGNIPVAIIIGSMIISLGLVVAAAIQLKAQPKDIRPLPPAVTYIR